ncbi:NifU family protein [Actinocrispum wychmicini]|uniref:Fe-S cluster biogenesis protein NfuA n=1 Tax=Actinocrispum wychmicini TaxID=1213861 RepID=A0A4R2JTR5_9PSEU|nr:NifU family protein [Actinocrispum wychmicini]TCO62392.1 Fe-S cluster biogenesis protein NfuA [Actinocrispum wychmicini]
MSDARGVGERVEQLLGGLRPGRDKETAEELVRLLVTMYGDGLTRIMALLGDSPVVADLVADPLVESLLLLHDLHPVDVDTRIQRALDQVRPYLGSHAGGVDYLGVSEDGMAQLRLQGNCQGCPSSTVTVKMAIESAIMAAAPDIAGVAVAGVTASPELLQIGMGPPPSWNAVDVGPPNGRAKAVTVDGVQVVLCSVRGTLYAYKDMCVCGSPLGTVSIVDAVLACPTCGTRFDVRNAGRGVDDPAQHLEPLPLLSDSQGVRVAVPS